MRVGIEGASFDPSVYAAGFAYGASLPSLLSSALAGAEVCDARDLFAHLRAALTTTERLHIDTARQRLVVEVDMTDPEFFTKPFPRATMEYAASDLKIEPFNCSREGVTGTIRK